ncbi:hypothetical protein DEU56DRAFT_978413 [Suillus clintonianus]|uniref:uncharacterized protein n=1 Tax=Suillus clintonianus TaxID=1904413 RepID=UPI001B884B27|nr:uncharacterized protein DEU56DRAFT_978413 [Suillus clintonianus]KAG2147584.1 hypothetical protein DEU56DRAFT_978413 [Suillus clintonianus]
MMSNLHLSSMSRSFISICTRRPGAAYTITALQLSEFLSLKQFKMRVRIMPRAEAEQLQVLCALSHWQCNACQTLEHIIIFSFDSEDEETSNNSSTAIAQSLRFTQLRILGLIFENCPIYRKSDLLMKAMSSWPRIRYMTLADNQLRPLTVAFPDAEAAARIIFSTLPCINQVDHADPEEWDEINQHPSFQSSAVAGRYITPEATSNPNSGFKYID